MIDVEYAEAKEKGHIEGQIKFLFCVRFCFQLCRLAQIHAGKCKPDLHCKSGFSEDLLVT